MDTKVKDKKASGGDVGRETQLALFRMQLELRYCEKRAYDLFLQNLIKGTSHLSLGQEAIAAGFGVAMRPDDWTFCTYRGHAHTLARGASMAGVLGELMGRQCGLLGGKGGSMHLTDVEKGAMGSYAIIGAHLPVAAGAAWSAQYRGTEQVAVCFFGDGTTNIGAFHEALNFSVVWKLPVIFVCENNLYMEYTPISAVTAVEHPAADRASAYNLEKVVIDGNDPEEVYLTAMKYMNRARKGGGPALIEAMTYRHSGHSRADPAKYRPDGELEKWLKRYPINAYRDHLVKQCIADATLKDIETDTMRRVDEATATAKASPVPSLSEINKNVWADGSTAWRN